MFGHSNNLLWNNAYKYIARFLKRRNLTFQERLNDFSYLFYNNETGNPLVLILIHYEKVGVDILKYHLNEAIIENVENFILVYEKDMTSSCQKIISNFFQYNIELFQLSEFQYDMTEFYYYQPHEVVSNEEKNELLSLYKNMIPIVLQNDPVVRYFGFKKNDILKIKRNNVCQNEIFYRVVK